MAITPTELRRDLYRYLDDVLTTGISLEIERHGRVLRLVADDEPSRLERLTRQRVNDLLRDDDAIVTPWHWGEPDLLDAAEDRGATA